MSRQIHPRVSAWARHTIKVTVGEPRRLAQSAISLQLLLKPEQGWVGTPGASACLSLPEFHCLPWGVNLIQSWQTYHEGPLCWDLHPVQQGTVCFPGFGCAEDASGSLDFFKVILRLLWQRCPQHGAFLTSKNACLYMCGKDTNGDLSVWYFERRDEWR